MHLISRNLWNIEIVLIFVSNPVLQVAWEEEVDTVWRTTEAGMEEEDKEVTQVFFLKTGLGPLIHIIIQNAHT